MAFIADSLAIAGKDLRVEWRSKERLVGMLTFSVLVAIVFSFSIDPAVAPRPLFSAMVWVTILFAGLLGLGRSFALEKEQDAMVGILLTPIDRGAFYFGKFLANLALLLTAVTAIYLLYALFFQLDGGGSLLGVALIIGLGCVGFMALGTLFSAVSSATRMGETLLPILLLPLLIPVVIFGAGATQRLFNGRPLDEVMSFVRMLAAFDIVFLVVCILIFDSVVEE